MAGEIEDTASEKSGIGGLGENNNGKEKAVIPKMRFALVKIDVEGFEIRVLRGMRTLLQEDLVDSLLAELGPARWSLA